MRRKRWAILTGTVALLLDLLAAGCRHAEQRSPFVRGVLSKGRQSMPYAVFVPRDYSSSKRWPVILFLHPFGQRGDDGVAETQVGLGPVLQQHPDWFPCLVVMPQARRSVVKWSGDVNDRALQALEAVVRQYHGDRRRLYLTGCSMGGAGCWRIAVAHPARFAAVMPICGRGEPALIAPTLKSLPIWVFHGARDRIVPVRFSRDIVQSLRSAGSTKLRYTEYPDLGHDSWDRAYSDHAAIAWLLAQKR